MSVSVESDKCYGHRIVLALRGSVDTIKNMQKPGHRYHNNRFAHSLVSSHVHSDCSNYLTGSVA